MSVLSINIKIKNIISEVSKKDLSSSETEDVLNIILSLGNWKNIRTGLLNILVENDSSLWDETVAYIYYFQNRGYKFDDTKTIAALYSCLSSSETIDENLAWTITKNLKSIPYLSDYDPLQDPEILLEIENIKIKKNGSKNQL